jgi:NADH-quinone oxidoreductase subunit K
MIVPYNHILILAGLVFLLGAACTVARRNLIMILVGVEIIGINWTARPLWFSSLPWLRLKSQSAWL